MALPGWLKEEVEATLDRSIEEVQPIGEGGGEQMSIVAYGEGASALLKWRDDAPAGLFAAEADGMRALRDAAGDDLTVPEVLGHGDRWLMMANVEESEQKKAAADALGRGLADLHRNEGQGRYGYASDNFLAGLPQPNGWSDSWAEFFREKRLRHALGLLAENGDLSDARRARVEDVIDRTPDLLASADIRPSLLHGHLGQHEWMSEQGGAAVLVDPAVYYGHREVDLAALRLLGDAPRAFTDAYKEDYPLDPGSEQRLALYQVYFALMHMALGEDFGEQLDGLLKQLAE